ncbi:MAG: hypothetical protein U1F52_08030 [Burkholderiales bacterium]
MKACLRATPVLLLAAGALLGGCADSAHNLYEGKRASDTLMQTPMERATQPAKSHEEYERERSKASDKY